MQYLDLETNKIDMTKGIFILLTDSSNIHKKKSYNYLNFPIVGDLKKDILVKRMCKGKNC